MMAAVDDVIGNVTQALKASGKWDNTLIIFSSDNGGPQDHADNYPLRCVKGSCGWYHPPAHLVARGSKGNDFEGGTRVNAFLNGGFLPADRQGKVVEGYMHICDWYDLLLDMLQPEVFCGGQQPHTTPDLAGLGMLHFAAWLE